VAVIAQKDAPCEGFMNAQAETWLILDDASIDRRHMVQAIADLNLNIRLLQAAFITEAKEILEKENVSVFLSDFYLRNGLNTSRFLSELRASMPRLPIVVVTNQTGNQEAPYKAGADAVIPKHVSLPEFTKSIAAAVKHAKHLRSLSVPAPSDSKIYIPRDIAADLHRIERRPMGNVLISSESGMGRTTLAKHLAARIVSENSATFPAGVHKLRVAKKGSGQAESEIEECLFGSAALRSDRVVGLLERAQDGVLIIDDAHHLSANAQLALKNLWEQGSAQMRNGALVRAQRIFLILTSHNSALLNRAENFERGFLQTVVASRIAIPDFTELREEYSDIFRSFVESQSPRANSPLTGSEEFYIKLMQAVCASPHRVTFRSLSHTIEAACDIGLCQRRSIVLPDDLQDMPFLYEQVQPAFSNDNQNAFSFVDSSDPVSPEQWKEFFHTIRSGTFAQAESQLMNMMLTYAGIRFNNNKARIADALGLSRATLYRFPQVNLPSNRGPHAKQTDA
jgi:DNA-binding NtrC family response regulator